MLFKRQNGMLIFLNFKPYKNMIVYDVKKHLDSYSLFANTRRSGKGKHITEKKQATVTYKNHEVNLH